MSEILGCEWEAGDKARIRKGWAHAGLELKVYGPAIFEKQWWVPVKFPDETDPTFFKESALEKLRSKEIRPVMYAIGQLYPEHQIGIWEGPNPDLSVMMCIAAKNENSVIIRFNEDETEQFLYRWDERHSRWRRARMVEVCDEDIAREELL
jgi:hypothetical protein